MPFAERFLVVVVEEEGGCEEEGEGEEDGGEGDEAGGGAGEGR